MDSNYQHPLAIEEGEIEEPTVNDLLPLLQGRLKAAKDFTKDFQDEVKRCLEDYEGKEKSFSESLKSGKPDLQRRYEFIIPYIFATHESMLSSIFEKPPALIFTGRGAQDEDKSRKVTATYDYLWDLLDLDTVMTDISWWFLLVGFVSVHGSFLSEYHEVPALDEYGEPMLDENGEPIMTIQYDYNDPTIEVGDPSKEYWSPESQFSVKADKVPYYFREALSTPESIEATYGVKTEAGEDIASDISKTRDDSITDDSKRVKVYYGHTSVPEKYADLVEDWEFGAEYYFIFTSKEVLHVQKSKGKLCRLGKYLGRPNQFFGFGIGKTLRASQREISIRRGQQIRYADVAAYAKIAIPLSSTVDLKALKDPRELVAITFDGTPPQYLSPPDMSNTLVLSEQKAREDAQFISGMLDISNGGQTSNTVKTATGQTIFAESAEKRIKRIRKELGKVLRETMVMLFKLCQENWDESKLITITDDEGNETDLEITKEDFADIDFDNDIDIDFESVTVNKEVAREQAIALYDKTKDDPIVERKKLFKKMLRDGFGEKNPDIYIKDSDLVPGMRLVDEQSGMAFVVGEDGELSPEEDTQELADPSGTQDLANTQAGALDVGP